MQKKQLVIIFIILLTQSIPTGLARTTFQHNRGTFQQEGEKNSSIEETLSRSRIDQEEKNYKKTVSSSEEIHALAKDLLKAVHDHAQLSGEDQKKLNKIEKLAKQVRSDQGGGGSETESESQPENLTAALEQLQTAAEAIEKESRQLTRHAVSATLVANLNQVLALTKAIKKLKGK